MNDIYKILSDNNIKVKHTSDGNQKVKCPQCQPPHNPKDNPLSVSIDGGTVLWKCHHCEWSGGHKENYGAKFYNKPAKKSYYKPPIVEKNPSTEMYKFFNDRGISNETVNNIGIKSDKKMIAFQYFEADGSVANIKYRGHNKTFVQTPGTKPMLYNYNNIYDQDEIIFVEGEMDVCALWEIGYTNATSLPGGAPKEFKGDERDKRFAPLQNCPLVAKKVIIFTDTDDPGKALHKELVHRFGKDKCWYVETPKDCKDANDVLMKHGKEVLNEILKDSQPYPVDGLYTVKDYYDEVLDLYDGNFEKPIRIGLENVDDIYQVMPGTFCVVTGIPNHGKSLLLDQILILLAENHGWKFVMFSPEHKTSMHIRRMVQMYLQKSFEEGFSNRMTKEELEKGMKWINKHFFFMETHDEVPSIDLLLDISKSAIYKFGCKGVVLDPFNEISAVRGQNQREDEWIRDFVSKCKRFTRLHSICFWVVAHPTKMVREKDGKYAIPDSYSISGSAHWSNLSDVILTVYRDIEEKETKLITRKIREQDLYGKIGEAVLEYDMSNRRFVAKTYPIDDYINIYND